MKEDIIRQIQVAEAQAEQKLQDARARAENILHDARHQAVEERTALINAAHKDAKSLFEQGVAHFEPELKNLQKQFQDGMAQDSARAQKTFEDVVESVVSEFQTRVGQSE